MQFEIKTTTNTTTKLGRPVVGTLLMSADGRLRLEPEPRGGEPTTQ